MNDVSCGEQSSKLGDICHGGCHMSIIP
jgi:hypothetical protein